MRWARLAASLLVLLVLLWGADAYVSRLEKSSPYVASRRLTKDPWIVRGPVVYLWHGGGTYLGRSAVWDQWHVSTTCVYLKHWRLSVSWVNVLGAR